MKWIIHYAGKPLALNLNVPHKEGMKLFTGENRKGFRIFTKFTVSKISKHHMTKLLERSNLEAQNIS